MTSGRSSPSATGATVKQLPPLPVVPPDLYGSSSSCSSDAGKWEESLKKVVPAIVVIRVCLCSAFDGDRASYAHATGFVVDKARGIILTNRHVVTSGPSVADAIFMNKEEVDLTPIYFDPVHDFGFFRFDAKAVKFMEIAEISLNPDGAKVGVDIRVIGNDSGEKLSILPGILARLDRAAPEYDEPYSDFNTFYLAAASSTSGGSSGSPVLTADGKVLSQALPAVALNCGSQEQSAAAYYLPLPKVVRALDLIQRGEKVTRGTVQTILLHTGFDEARRLGLAPDTEATLRKAFPEETGVLVVNQVIPKGPADNILEPGDIVVRMNGDLITTFLPWEEGLDQAVGGQVEMQVQRGGEEVTVKLTVGDLHDITPREYLGASSGVIHAVSYQQAKNFNVPVEGVFIAQTGHMFHRARLDKRSLIISIGSDATPDLDACEAALCKHADGARVSVRFKRLSDIHRTATAVITMDRKWFPMQRVRHNASDGLWHATPSPLPPPTPPQPSTVLPPVEVHGASDGVYSERRESASTGGISSSLVMVTFSTPHLVDGVESMSVADVGVVVDAEFGLVVVDRTTVQVALGDVMLTFNGSEEVTARPIFVHPIHNFSVVQFDPSTVKGFFTAAVLSSRETEGDESNGSSSSSSSSDDSADERAAAAPVSTVAKEKEDGGTAAQMNGSSSSPVKGYEDLSPPPLRPGDAADFHGLTTTNAAVRRRTVVVKLERLLLKTCDSPQFTPHSVEVLQFDQMSSSMGGVFVAAADDTPSSSSSATAASMGDAKARIRPVVLAFWFSFSHSERNHRYYSMHGLPAPVVGRAVARIRRDLQAQKHKKKLGIVAPAAAVTEVGRSEATAEEAAEAAETTDSADDGSAASSVPGTRVGIGLDGAKESLGAAPCLPVELVAVALSKARAGLGLSEAWSRKIEDKCGKRQKQVLEVRRCLAGTPAFSVLETGDIILTVDGKLVTNFREVEVEVEDAEGSPVQLTILRDLEEQEVTVIPSYLPTRETDRLFMWAGMMVQTPHLAVLQLGFLPKEGGGVYASRWYGGSPANKYMLGNHNWIVEVNGVPTPTLDAFLTAVKDIGHKSPVRVKTVDLTSKVEVTTLRTDHHYWPTLELRHSEDGWTRTEHAGPNPPKLSAVNGENGGHYTATPQASRE